jgi:arylsulfatase A-like enzyme
MSKSSGPTNIVVFVGDAVRYDYSASKLAELGPTIKTAAASIHTPASFASMFTGHYPFEHGVFGFDNRLSEEHFSLFELDGYHTALSGETGLDEHINNIFNDVGYSPVEEVKNPFIWVVRDAGGHSPYNKFYKKGKYDFDHITGVEYLNKNAGQISKLKREYDQGVNSSIDRFLQVKDTVEERGLGDDTLFIYTSDHGELLGEHGFIGHNHIACPELVYVPTTLIHPSIDQIDTDFMRHIDLVPSILDTLDEPTANMPGTSVLSHSGGIDRVGLNHYKLSTYGANFFSFDREIKSCWDSSGGYSFLESNTIETLVLYFGILYSSHVGKHIFRSREFINSFKHFIENEATWGDPQFSQEEAKERIENSVKDDVQSHSNELEDNVREQLVDLGYR